MACLPGAAKPGPAVVAADQEYLTRIACRIVHKTPGPVRHLDALIDVNVNTLSSNRADHTVSAGIHDNRRLDVAVRHVEILLPRDRFNVSMSLDGRPHLRINHMDLDLYVETVIDERTYILHCFRDFDSGNRGWE